MLTVGSRFKARLQVRQKCVFFQISLELCGFFMFFSGFSRSRKSFSRSPTFNNHARSRSHRHTTLQNPLLRPRPLLSAASTAAPAASSRWTTASWPLRAAWCSDVQPGSARRGGWRWRSSKLHGEVVFPSETMPKRWKALLGWPQVWTGLGNLLLHHIRISRPFTHSSMHWPSVWPFKHCYMTHDSEWTSKIHLWYQIETGNIHKKNWQAKKPRSKGCEEGLKRCPFSIKFRHISKSLGVFPNSKLYTLNLVYWSWFLHGHYYSPLILKDFHHL